MPRQVDDLAGLSFVLRTAVTALRGIARRAAWIAAACGLTCGLTGAAQDGAARFVPPSVLPGIGAHDRREAVDVTRAPWRGVVRVQTELGGRCTGALIGPRSVLSAAHCLYGRATGRPVRPGSVHVLTGYAHGDYAGHARAVAFVIGPGFAIGPDQGAPVLAAVHADWAVLTLDSPLGPADRTLPLLRQPPEAGMQAMLGGNEQDRAHALVADVACSVTGLVHDEAGNVLIRHDCAATRGASGAPLLVRAPDGRWSVAGISAVAAAGSSGGYAVPVAAVAAGALTGPR